MTSIAAILETQKSLESALEKRMKDFEAQLKLSSSEKDIRIPQLHEDFKSFKDLVWNVLTLLRQQIGEILKSLDYHEARYRSKFLLLCGVPEKPDEDLCVTVATLLQRHMEIKDFQSSSIRSCYRLGSFTKGRNRPVVIRFVNYDLRSLAWKCKTKLKGTSLVVREFLTKTRQALFYAARDHCGIANAWTSDGNVFVKTPNGNRVKIGCSEELSAVMKQFPSATSAGEAEGVVAAVESATLTSRTASTRLKRPTKSAK
ncbi:unnamed protein product [Diatraea saccharalis]|uniref:Uncharacterized protein n=1 Tax=Diatraea saccharalis TaxID=40085 RepID=A0A9N9WJG2_9NEOP|nr:unnamed protein product [Diatraea saccharalis]